MAGPHDYGGEMAEKLQGEIEQKSGYIRELSDALEEARKERDAALLQAQTARAAGDKYQYAGIATAEKLIDERGALELQNRELRETLFDKETVITREMNRAAVAERLLGEERERCAKIVEEFDDWAWPDKKSEAYREAGDWAGPDTIVSLKKLAAEIRREPEKRKCEHKTVMTFDGLGVRYKCQLCGEYISEY